MRLRSLEHQMERNRVLHFQHLISEHCARCTLTGNNSIFQNCHIQSIVSEAMMSCSITNGMTHKVVIPESMSVIAYDMFVANSSQNSLSRQSTARGGCFATVHNVLHKCTCQFNVCIPQPPLFTAIPTPLTSLEWKEKSRLLLLLTAVSARPH